MLLGSRVPVRCSDVPVSGVTHHHQYRERHRHEERREKKARDGVLTGECHRHRQRENDEKCVHHGQHDNHDEDGMQTLPPRGVMAVRHTGSMAGRLALAGRPRCRATFRWTQQRSRNISSTTRPPAWSSGVTFAKVRGWSLTEAGRKENERLLASKLNEVSARDVVTQSHAAFVPLSARFLDAITRGQLRPTRWDAMASNDHSDWAWDERVLGELASLSRRLRTIEEPLAARLVRFGGYADRIAAALARVDQGERRWVDEPKIDSCHTVWFEFHEDLLATLGLARGVDT